MKNVLKVLSALSKVSGAVMVLNSVSHLAPGNSKITKALDDLDVQLQKLDGAIGIIRLIARSPASEP